MNISDEQRTAIESHIRERMPQKKCSSCDSNDWIFTSVVFMPSAMREADMKTAIPAIPLICRGCGDMQFLHPHSVRGFITITENEKDA